MSIKSGNVNALIKKAETIVSLIVSFPKGKRPETIFKRLEKQGWMVSSTEQSLMLCQEASEVTCLHPVQNEEECEEVAASAAHTLSYATSSLQVA
jgi:hypothetical protein